MPSGHQLGVGAALGAGVGGRVGTTVGGSEGTGVGRSVGGSVGAGVGYSVGVCDGAKDGLLVVGGFVVGSSVGGRVGEGVGISVGGRVGKWVGLKVGDTVGDDVGATVRLLASSSFSTRCSSHAFFIPTKQNDVSMNVAYDTKLASCPPNVSVATPPSSPMTPAKKAALQTDESARNGP